MVWWLAPSIIGVILFGIIVGLLVSRQVLRAQKKNLTFFPKQKMLTADASAGRSVFQDSHQTESVTAENQAAARKTLTHMPTDERLKVYLDMQRNSSTVKTPLSAALTELNNNLSIARRPVTNNLVNFQTDIWKSKRSEFNPISADLMAELTEAYVDMMLANNIVWLVMELGRNSQDLKEGYAKLSNKVAERLLRIMPAVRDCFK